MTAKFTDFIKSGPPAPKALLVPDHRFFVRMVPIVNAVTPADVASQVELALETLSPFSPPQLYYGYYWVSGSPQALVFAAYRKRFTAEQTAAWKDAEWVAPTFAALLNTAPTRPTTMIVPTADGLTAIYWDGGPMPSIQTRTLSAEATDEDRIKARDELIREGGGERTVLDLPTTPEVVVSSDENKFSFRAGDFAADVPTAVAAMADVRDKTELAALRKQRSRDLILWRVLAGCAAALLIFAIAEVGLVGARKVWLKSMNTKLTAQRPLVESIMRDSELAQYIGDLSTKRFLPFEMLEQVGPARGNVQFLRVSAVNMYTLLIEAQTTNGGDVEAYTNALRKLPAVADIKVDNQSTARGMTTFRLTVAFKPDTVKPVVARL